MMRVEREVDVTAPPERVWATLWDVPRMVACVPGCAEAREVEPHRRYAATMTQKVGPISLSVPLDVIVSSVVPATSLALEAKGRDGVLGAVITVSVGLAVTPRATGSRVTLRAEGRILGKLGALGHGVIQRKAEELVDEFGTRLRRVVEA